MRLRLMVTGSKGHNVYPGSVPLDLVKVAKQIGPQCEATKNKDRVGGHDLCVLG